MVKCGVSIFCRYLKWVIVSVRNRVRIRDIVGLGLDYHFKHLHICSTSSHPHNFMPAMTFVSLSNLRLSLATTQRDKLLLSSMFLSMLHDASSFITV